jgi:LacI family transcriptional regulator
VEEGVSAVPQPVKLQDVADAAGVSIATASRALAGKKRVSAETVQTVLEAADRLGYTVDPIARALREGSTRTVGMIVPVVGNPYFSELIAAVGDELQAAGFELILADSHGDVTQEARRLRTLVGRRVDGILLVSHSSTESAPAVDEAMRSVPVVQIDRKIDRLGSDFVGIDADQAMRLLLEHLVERGVRRVVLASADDQNSVGRGRREAFERLVDELDLIAAPHVIGDFSVEAGRAAADEIVRRGGVPDAVVAGSDVNAVGLISGFRSHGMQVPDAVLVTGFDGTQLSELYNPSITTVRQPVRALARTAVSFLSSRIADPTSPARDSRIGAELVVRASTTA